MYITDIPDSRDMSVFDKKVYKHWCNEAVTVEEVALHFNITVGRCNVIIDIGLDLESKE